MPDLKAVKDDGTELSEELRQLTEQAKLFARSSKSEATRRAYRADFSHFDNWCAEQSFSSLPTTVDAACLYFTHLAEKEFACSTIMRKKSAIAQAHKLRNLAVPVEDDRVREVLKGIRRELGTASDSKKPLSTVEVRRILQTLDRDSTIGRRDAGLLITGFSGGLRRSELVGLDVSDIERRNRGIILRIRSSKTDPEGQGQLVGIPAGQHKITCPVRALERWLDRAKIESGPVFRAVDKGGEVSSDRFSGRAVALVVRRSVEAIGLDPEKFSAHSLRAGFATTAAKNGATEREIMNQTRHRSRAVLRGYIEEGSVLNSNPAGKIGL